MEQDIPISIISLNDSLMITDINKCFETEVSKITGNIDLKSIIGKSIKEIIPGYENNLYKKNVDVIINGNKLKCRLSVSSTHKFVYIELFHSTKRFMDFLAYEFKTPVSAAVEMSSLIPASKNQKKYIEALQENNMRLIKLLVNTIDYLKILTSHINFQLDIVDIKTIFLEAKSRVKKKKDTSINFDIPDNEKINIDKKRFLEMVVHILTYLSSRTDKGYINIKSKTVDGILIVYFTDFGKKIEETDIFSGFVDKDYIKDSSGLELPIAKGLCKGMGGDLTLESSTDYSSTFKISFPLNL